MSCVREYYICRQLRLKYLSRIFLKSVLGRTQVVLYYVTVGKLSAISEKVGRWLSHISCGRFSVEESPFYVTEMYNASGKPLTDVAYIDAMDEIMDDWGRSVFRSKNSLFSFLNKKFYAIKDDLKLWMKHRVAWPTFDTVLLIEMAHWLSSNPNSRLCGSKVSVVTDSAYYGMDVVVNYAHRTNVPVLLFGPSLEIKENLIVVFIYQLLNSVFSAGYLSPRRFRNHPEAKQTKICTFHYGMTNFTDFFGKRNYPLFWYPASGIPSHRIIIFSRSSADIDSAESRRISSLGFRLVACDGFSKKRNEMVPRHRCSWRVFRLFLKYAAESVRLLFKVKNKATFEQWKILSLLSCVLPYWEDFFDQNNVKILFKPGVLFSDLDIAAKLAGAATVSYQYSNHMRLDMGHHDSCDAFFLWGEFYEKLYQHRHSQAKNLIQTGYIFDYTFNVLDKQAASLRQSLTGKGIDFILSVFDESFILSSFLFKKGVVEDILSLYKTLFVYVLQNTTVGIIIKPKRNEHQSILRSFEQTSHLMRRLEQSGRILFVDASKFPAEAGKASDLAVGMISNSAAALECGLAGVPAIFYDAGRMGHANPSYGVGKNKFIFSDVDRMMGVIEQYRKTGNFSEGSGDWSSFIKDKDPFRDGKANQRIGFYLRTLLGYMDNGLRKEKAIEETNRIYADRFGRDKVDVISGMETLREVETCS